MTIRRWTCVCGHEYDQQVVLGPSPNVSGEKTAWCPACGKKPAHGSPAFELVSDEELAEAAELCRTATPGPWYWIDRWALVTDAQGGATVLEGTSGSVAIWNGGLHGPDARLVALARELLPKLLAEVQARRG